MELLNKLRAISERISKLKQQVETEEATKNAFVMPFIASLGYDVFNPLEVKPEFIADIGIKKGEKVDYCIYRDGQPIIIVECKHWREGLNPHNSQLFRYFHVCSVRFAILTNGVQYRFYTDLENANKMDEKPFLEFNLENINEGIVNELRQFTKENFDVEQVFSNAGNLKFSKELKEALSAEFREPSEDFVKYFTQKVYSGRITGKVLDQFKPLVQSSVKSLISEMIRERLQTALNSENEESIPPVQANGNGLPPTTEPAVIEASTDDDGIVTTEEEKEAFFIIRAILRKVVDADRVVMRDVKSYCGILLDDNNRKPICRLRFNGLQKQVGIFNADRQEEKFSIANLGEIYNYTDHLLGAVSIYQKEEV